MLWAGFESWDIRCSKLFVGEAVESTGEFCFDRCILVQSYRHVKMLACLCQRLPCHCWTGWWFCIVGFAATVIVNTITLMIAKMRIGGGDECSYIHPSWQELTKKWGRDKKWRLQIQTSNTGIHGTVVGFHFLAFSETFVGFGIVNLETLRCRCQWIHHIAVKACDSIASAFRMSY